MDALNVRGLPLSGIACTFVVLAGCGGGDDALRAEDACAGRPTAKGGGEAILFGALDRLTVDDLCRRFGVPTERIREGDEERWRYDGLTLRVDPDAERVVGVEPRG